MSRFFITIFAVFLCLPVNAWAQDDPLIQTSAKQAIVLDYETGAVLLDKNADERMPTSSMSKVMSIYLVFEALKRGDVELDDEFLVSEKAWRKGGSKMFVEVNKYVRVEDLIRGVVIQSGNDASIVLAEGLAGSEAAFAEGLNSKAEELGMDDSHFMNASGWPDPDHYSTARDLATLAYNMIKNFPEYYNYYAEKEFTYNNITQKNRNPLLYRDIGADGIKTGHTEAGGYGLIGSGAHNGRRVIIVINGLDSEADRAQESAKLLEWGLKRFENRKLLSAGDVVEQAEVAMGVEDSVALSVREDVLATLPKLALSELKVNATFKSPLIAPVEAGQEVGVLNINVPHLSPISVPLYAAEDVEELGFFAKTLAKAKVFFMKGI